MKTERLNAFTDAVIAIVMTIMVLEIRLPEEPSWHGFRTMVPILGIYALSFINIGIFWNNHHHMMQAARRIDGRVLWANLFLLFWLSLVPFEIRWMGEAGIVALPVAAYGGVLMMAAIAYLLLERELMRVEGESSQIKQATGGRLKEWLSFSAFAAALPLAFVSPYTSVAIYVAVAVMWLVPDRRFERS
jgi:uncharacterized membrane protein